MPETSGEYYPKTGEIDLMKYYNYEFDKTTIINKSAGNLKIF